MNKNEILDKSRKENKKLDEMERDALYRAGYMASVVGGLLCICLPLLESILMRKINNGPWIIFFCDGRNNVIGEVFLFEEKT